MQDHFLKYTDKLLRDGTAIPESIRFYRLDDVVIASKRDEWMPLFTEIFSGLNVTALVFAKTTLPFADLLIERSNGEDERLVPKDSETRVFLHDIPFIRTREWTGKTPSERAVLIVRRLKERKAIIIQGVGVVSTGGVTVEQAYIGFSTVFHTTFVKYLLDLLIDGFKLPGEQQNFDRIATSLLRTPALDDLEFRTEFRTGLQEMRNEEQKNIYREICRVGRYTVEKGYVDSFFGNISYFDGKTIFISQTTSSLDELEGHIDPVPLDGSSTAGLSASSELPAHRAVYLSSTFHAILHGHPRFSIVMSMYCREENCEVEDCNRLCNRKRSVCGVPVVAGETGVGGLSRSVPAAIQESGVCIVYGHGVFAAGEHAFRDAFIRMADVENQCREEYFKLVDQRKK